MSKAREDIEDIEPMDNHHNWHGYQEWYINGQIWLRGHYKHGDRIGYNETFGEYEYDKIIHSLNDLDDFDISKTEFYIN